MVGEINSMVGYHLMTEGHSIQLGSGERCDPPTGPGQRPDKNNTTTNNNISEFLIKSQSNPSLKFLIKWFLVKKQHVYQTYDMKYLNAAGKKFVKRNRHQNKT